STPAMTLIMPLVMEPRKRRRVGSPVEIGSLVDICAGTLCLERRRDIISALMRQRPAREWRKVAMLRRALLVVLIAVAAIPIAAQGPTGWKVRPDETSATLGAMPTEKGFQLTGGPGIFF